MRIALVIGGSGMLAGFVKKLSQEFDIVGVVARNIDKLDILKQYSDSIIPLRVDYTNLEDLKSKLNEFTHTYGKVELVVSWVHSTSPDAPIIVAQYCDSDFYEVTGESGKEPNDISRQHEKIINKLGINYHRVILGHIGDRWLTNQEISDGVYDAIQAEKVETVVGNI